MITSELGTPGTTLPFTEFENDYEFDTATYPIIFCGARTYYVFDSFGVAQTYLTVDSPNKIITLQSLTVGDASLTVIPVILRMELNNWLTVTYDHDFEVEITVCQV